MRLTLLFLVIFLASSPTEILAQSADSIVQPDDEAHFEDHCAIRAAPKSWWYPEATKSISSDSIHGDAAEPGNPYYAESALYGCGPHLFQGNTVDFTSEPLRSHLLRQPAWAVSEKDEKVGPLLNSSIQFSTKDFPVELRINSKRSFKIEATGLPKYVPDRPFVLATRVIGTNGLVHVPLVRQGSNQVSGKSTYEFEGEVGVVHEGSYALEVFLTWLYESEATGKWEDDAPLYVGQLVLRRAFQGLNGHPRDINDLCEKPICGPGDLTIGLAGRWMSTNLFEKCGLVYDTLELSDELGYNKGLVYVPDTCNFEFPSTSEFYERCKTQNVSSIGITNGVESKNKANSLVNEQFVNILDFLSFGNLGEHDMRTFKSEIDVKSGWRTVSGFYQPKHDLTKRAKRHFEYSYTSLHQEHDRVVIHTVVTTPGRVGQGPDGLYEPRFQVRENIDFISRAVTTQKCLENPGKCIILIAPNMARQDPRVKMNRGAEYARFTYTNAAFVIDGIRGFIDAHYAKKITVVDSAAITEGRWDASWDGIHYLYHVNKVQSNLKKQDQGGVSTMITAALLTAICPKTSASLGNDKRQ